MTTLGIDRQAVGAAPAYGRWRLRLGISAVGSVVVLSIGALIVGLPAMLEGAIGSYGAVVVFFAAFAGLHTGFDVLGGRVLPRRAGRSSPEIGRFAVGLARGVAVHTSVLVLVGVLMLGATGPVGRWGFVLGGIGAMVAMLLARPVIARLMSGVWIEHEASLGGCRFASAADEGFTGGVLGVVRARAVVLPLAWREGLPERVLGVVSQRRRLAVSTGGWARGRAAAIAFTVAGLLVAAFSVPGGWVGGSAGVIGFSLVFTLWSFGGLLVLPTLSRRASRSLDRAVLAAGVVADELTAAAQALDRLQDDEPRRPGWIERIFHPIPSVSARASWAAGDVGGGSAGAWDVARTSIYLSWAGLGLLSRSVHCNCGRPDLWVFLPVE